MPVERMVGRRRMKRKRRTTRVRRIFHQRPRFLRGAGGTVAGVEDGLAGGGFVMGIPSGFLGGDTGIILCERSLEGEGNAKRRYRSVAAGLGRG